MFDVDSSVTRFVTCSYQYVFYVLTNSNREDAKFQSLFEEAGLRIVRMELQSGFLRNRTVTLLPVKMYALRPKAQTTE